MATDLSTLNEQQKNAILESINHNIVLLAAAGSGKTFTLTKRTEYLINDCNVNPENLMLITFTNKAAKEILNRVAKITPDAYKMWIGTFHGICVKLLRKFGYVMGINNFSIISPKEQTKMIRDIYTSNYGETDNKTIKRFRNKISAYKSNLQNPSYVLQLSNNGKEMYQFAGVYQEYQNKCWNNKTFDFDDLIIYTILLLNSYPDVRKWINDNIKYVMADECLPGYQLVETLEGPKTIESLYHSYIKGLEIPLIKSYNINTDVFEYKPMTFAKETKNREVFRITTYNNYILDCTDNHKVLTKRGYVMVKDLNIDFDSLYINYDDSYKFGLIKSIEPIEQNTVYDITVTDNHNFITINPNNNNGIIVHNCQDTSTDQYTLIRLLANNNNIMLIGDINQSIYGFRNAKPQHLNDFVKTFPNTKLLKLEVNYRSTNTIISAANAVINNNDFGEKINMVSVNEVGSKIGIKTFSDYSYNPQEDEANWICSEIGMLVSCGNKEYKDFAIINRTNVQNKEIEKIFIKSGIPYTIVGSSSFWNSKEMRDILAYCKICFNPFDIISFKRVLSVTKGVGNTTIEKLLNYQTEKAFNCHEVISNILTNDPEVFKGVSKKALNELDLLNRLLNSTNNKCSDIARYIINSSSYTAELRNDFSDESKEKMESLKAIITSFEEFEDKGDLPESVIDQVSLMTDAKGEEKGNLDAVKIMTAHACKGLEFDTVFIGGVEEGLFPHWNSINSLMDSESAIEEERRLFYVAMTRAKKKLYITYCPRRNKESVKPSRFLSEIPEYLTETCF